MDEFLTSNSQDFGKPVVWDTLETLARDLQTLRAEARKEAEGRLDELSPEALLWLYQETKKRIGK